MSAEITPKPIRGPQLTRLCVLSFVNQGLVFPMYLAGLLVSPVLQRMSTEKVEALVTANARLLAEEGQLQEFLAVAEVLRQHGVALMAVLCLRTVGRFIGVVRMWRGKPDGFHVYTTSQLLGILLPMIIGGSIFFNWMGFICVLLWCFMYRVRTREMLQAV